MADANRENRHTERQPDPNPFVAFRRFADDQIASMFDQLALPNSATTAFDQAHNRSKPSHDEGAFTRARARDATLSGTPHDQWQRFASSYERATNPERRQIEAWGREDGAASGLDEGKGKGASDMKDKKTKRDAKSGLFGRALGALGKTSAGEEIERARRLKARNAERVSARREPETMWQSLASSRNAQKPMQASRLDDLERRTENASHEEEQKYEPWAITWRLDRENNEKEGEQSRGKEEAPWLQWVSDFEKRAEESERRLETTKADKTQIAEPRSTPVKPWSWGPLHLNLESWEKPACVEEKHEGDWKQFTRGLGGWLHDLGDEDEQGEHKPQAKSTLDKAQKYEPMEEGGPYDPRRLAEDERTRYQAPWLGAFEDLAAKHDNGDEEYDGICPWLREEAELKREHEDEHEDNEYDGICPWLREEAELKREQAEEDEDDTEYSAICPFLREGGLDDSEHAAVSHDKELDYYERRETSSQSLLPQQAHPTGAWLEAGLVESLTNVERKLMPDGTVVTKRRTKLRFEDGSEEVRDETEAHSAIDASMPEPRSPGGTRAKIEEGRTGRPLSSERGQVKENGKVSMKEQMEKQRRKAKEDGRKGWFW